MTAHQGLCAVMRGVMRVNFEVTQLQLALALRWPRLAQRRCLWPQSETAGHWQQVTARHARVGETQVESSHVPKDTGRRGTRGGTMQTRMNHNEMRGHHFRECPQARSWASDEAAMPREIHQRVERSTTQHTERCAKPNYPAVTLFRSPQSAMHFQASPASFWD
jgi:hypothetical protein